MDSHAHLHTAGKAASSFWGWFTGGAQHQYMKLAHCMDGDGLWIGITVALDVAVAAGYGLIALHWYRNERVLPVGPAKRALGTMRNIFLFCGICGYAFIPIKMVWPAWRLYDLVMAALVFYTWRYAWNARDLKVIYTELNRSERLAQDLEAVRAESQRKSFFLNAISHDLRTPLNGLMLQADVAQMNLDEKDPDALRESLAEIRGSARATADLLNSFLELGRLDWSQDQNVVEDVQLDSVLQRLVATHQPLAEQKGLYLRASVPKNLVVRTDRVKIERVLGNLLHNALKFTESGGVSVEVERRAGRDLAVRVADTGIGIARADQALLFEEFYQVRNHERDRKKGFGLGLAIARRLAQQLGGDVGVSSELGKGSRFDVVLRGVVASPAPTGAGPGAKSVAVGH